MIEVLAQSAVSFLLAKAAEGAVQSFGSDAYKTALAKLKGFFNYKFAGRKELDQLESDPNSFVLMISQEASENIAFKNELEELVKALRQSSENNDGSNVKYSNVDSVSNVNVETASGSNIGGRDVMAGNQFSGSGQTNNLGGDHRKGTFR